MRHLSLTALFLFNLVLAFAQEYTPSTVPNTKLENNSYVSNPDSILSESTVAEIDTTLINLERKTTSQVAVVVINSIGYADIFNFAQELYNTWGIGRSNSNGLLILLAKEQRTVRFHVGYGLEGVLPDVLCKQIQRDHMVEYFKAEDYEQGILNGVKEVAKILADPQYAAEIKAKQEYENRADNFENFLIIAGIILIPIFVIAWANKASRFSNSKDPEPTDYPQMRMKQWVWLVLFGLIPAMIILFFWLTMPDHADRLALATLYLYLMSMVFVRIIRERIMLKGFRDRRKFFEMTEYIRQSTGYWIMMALIFPLPFIVYLPMHFVRKKYYRNYPRKCKLCEGKMNKLNETEDDKYLDKAQLVEEQIDSVDYDVWQCEACKGTESWHFKNRWTSYKPCPKCNAVAYYLVGDKTIKAATYSSSGKGESTYQCKSCGKTERKSYSIAMLTTSSSSSSSSSSGSSYSSSSGSSGGSWGGGSSGGGGASSSW